MADTTPAASLGAKLDALDLTADEHALLCDLLTPADAEVSGYSRSISHMIVGLAMSRHNENAGNAVPVYRPANPNITVPVEQPRGI